MTSLNIGKQNNDLEQKREALEKAKQEVPFDEIPNEVPVGSYEKAEESSENVKFVCEQYPGFFFRLGEKRFRFDINRF